MTPPPKTIPLGRIQDLRSRADADRIAIRPGRTTFDDFIVRRYPSRLSLESFLKTLGGWQALVKTPTPLSMLVHPAFQIPQ